MSFPKEIDAKIKRDIISCEAAAAYEQVAKRIANDIELKGYPLSIALGAFEG